MRAPNLSVRERQAVRRFLGRVLAAGEPPVLRAILFGSKARGDFDRDSDVDVMLICDVHPDHRVPVGIRTACHADDISADTGVRLEPWTVAAADLELGARTPMLVDALADGVPLWPPDTLPVRLPFTPADARFCAECLLDWVHEGGTVTRRALAAGRLADAASRARDDITRLAAAALLLTGDTRHRRQSTLLRFEQRLVRPRLIPANVLPALAWSRTAYAPQRRGDSRPVPVAADAVRTARLGCALAGIMQREVAPWIVRRLDELRPISSLPVVPPWSPLPQTAAGPPRSGTFPCVAP